jgi:hypothetical protein
MLLARAYGNATHFDAATARLIEQRTSSA